MIKTRDEAQQPPERRDQRGQIYSPARRHRGLLLPGAQTRRHPHLHLSDRDLLHLETEPVPPLTDGQDVDLMCETVEREQTADPQREMRAEAGRTVGLKRLLAAQETLRAALVSPAERRAAPQ